MTDIPLSKENQVHFLIMVALEPATQEIIRQSDLTKSEQDDLIGICHSETTAKNKLESLLSKDWPRMAQAVEACFYEHRTEDEFKTALLGVIRGRDRQFVKRWANTLLDAVEDSPAWVDLVTDKYPEMVEPLRRFHATANAPTRERLMNMLAIRRPVVDALLDKYVGDDPRKAMQVDRPAKISLDGSIIDIEATADALKQALDARRPRYSWDGITTETYVRQDGELRRRVIFYDRSH
jgi:hypothetical protein